ncbi:MAG: iron ABC transporter ATP-binding protein [Porticoccaceae bacterium]|nr:iron ABC transporter ATP-binding protein [Porticoccaceae bacterium]|tara:strand:+ start:2096 stop:3145 length:1050 start_codon:yes stop_codon:yes gene_type:complete
MNEQLVLNGVSIEYPDTNAVTDVSFALPRGEIGCLLGPSGSGKTSLLRAIAGFEPIRDGEIKLRESIISTPTFRKPPEHRSVGMVFQDFALFPHLTVQQNIGFGLIQTNKEQKAIRVREMLELISLHPLAQRYPHELSGGQQQRVALARALAPDPEILLLDEPFSNLDSVRRSQLAAKVRALLKRRKITALMVTHDQDEAFAMSDRIVLLDQGRVAQIGSPRDLYRYPESLFAADFIGAGNLINLEIDAAGILLNGWGKLSSQQWPEKIEGRIKLLIRPDLVVFDKTKGHPLHIVEKLFQGANYLYHLATADGQTVSCLAPNDVDHSIGDELPVRFRLDQAVVFKTETT